MLNSKPNTRLVAGRHARSSMTTIVLQSKAIEHTFGAERNIHEAGKQACCLTTFSKSHSALQQQKEKIMFALCKHLHLDNVHFREWNGLFLGAQSHLHSRFSHRYVVAFAFFFCTNRSATAPAEGLVSSPLRLCWSWIADFVLSICTRDSGIKLFGGVDLSGSGWVKRNKICIAKDIRVQSSETKNNDQRTLHGNCVKCSSSETDQMALCTHRQLFFL